MTRSDALQSDVHHPHPIAVDGDGGEASSGVVLDQRTLIGVLAATDGPVCVVTHRGRDAAGEVEVDAKSHHSDATRVTAAREIARPLIGDLLAGELLHCVSNFLLSHSPQDLTPVATSVDDLNVRRVIASVMGRRSLWSNEDGRVRGHHS